MVRRIVVLACVALAACGPKQAEQGANAGGKILPGTISDAMIDLDRSRAEAPMGGPAGGVSSTRNDAAAALLGSARSREDEGVAAASPASDGATAAPDAGAAAKAADAAAPAAKPTPATAPKPAVTAPKPAAPARTKPAPRKPADEAGA